MGAYGTPEHLPGDNEETEYQYGYNQSNKVGSAHTALRPWQKILLVIYLCVVAFFGLVMLVNVSDWTDSKAIGIVLAVAYIFSSLFFSKRVKQRKRAWPLIVCSVITFFAFFCCGPASSQAVSNPQQPNITQKSTSQSQIVSSKSVTSSNKSQSTLSNAQKYYSVGENVAVRSGEGEYDIAIDSVKESKSRNEFADTNPKRVIIVSYTYKNVSCTEDVTISNLYLHVYDSSGKLLDVYPSDDVKEPARISTGKHYNASVAYGIDDNSEQVQIDLYDIFDPIKHAVTFQADIK